MNHKDKVADSLLSELEAVSILLHKTPYKWHEIHGSINILKNRNKAHYSKIRHKLFLDFRMIEDHQILIEGLDSYLNRAYQLAKQLEKSN